MVRERTQRVAYNVDEFSTTASKGRKRAAGKKKRSPLNPDLSMESDEGEQQESEGESEHEGEEEAAYSSKKEMLDDDEGSGSEEEVEAPKKPRQKPRKKAAKVAVVEKNADESMVGDSMMMVDREDSAVVSPARGAHQDMSMLIDDRGNNYYGK